MVLLGGKIFEMSCDLMDVTSLHRPDTDWRFVDARGHEHRWYVDGKPAATYRPSAALETPTLKRVFEKWGYYEDGDRYPIGHHECKECGEHIEPRYRADDTTQYIAGMRRYRVDGHNVSADEFKRQYILAGGKL